MEMGIPPIGHEDPLLKWSTLLVLARAGKFDEVVPILNARRVFSFPC